MLPRLLCTFFRLIIAWHAKKSSGNFFLRTNLTLIFYTLTFFLLGLRGLNFFPSCTSNFLFLFFFDSGEQNYLYFVKIIIAYAAMPPKSNFLKTVIRAPGKRAYAGIIPREKFVERNRMGYANKEKKKKFQMDLGIFGPEMRKHLSRGGVSLYLEVWKSDLI